ncbi:MBL fold metallo-hydrolase [Clostridium sp. 19966]|uniref:MBL fold metallo-hydrolase n=1 Tax=Clostridium sp. 19966 TaxID=2768166 RepID=UPI0028DEBF67|nr:MBL fold metallo-hydrolase [Clostridium sp. 19966]MDT8716692.1 MBL fold metallo-hydrolase [Clostridium sp. 19966]
MKIRCLGAAENVTGSCHMLNIMGKTILLDCGMYVGEDENEVNNSEFSFDPSSVECVILSHAHIDHSGRIPLLYKKGYKGKIISTKATEDLCTAMLPDSGHIAEMETEWKNRKRIRRGQEPLEPLYTAKDAAECIKNFEGHSYEEFIDIFEGVRIKFRDAGHLLGSAFTEIYVKEIGKKEIKLVYSGDIGNTNIPIIKDPTYIDSADYVIMETTYGDRVHEALKNEFEALSDIIKDTFKRGGNVIIPSFAVGRTQEVLYALNKFVEEDMTNLKVYVDSPLAYESSVVFQKNTNIFDEDAARALKNGDNPIDFKGLVYTRNAEDSMEINKIKSGAIIISSSGMCEAGRIKHHLKHNLWRKECSVVFVGYQANGTLGKSILDGAKKVKIFGEEVAVNAKIYNLHGLSGHADRNGLLKWICAYKNKPKKVILVHGDKGAQESFLKELIRKGFNAVIAKKDAVININESVEENEALKNKLMKYIQSIDDYSNISKEEVIRHIENIFKEA